MTGDWLAAFESLTPVTVIVPEYFSEMCIRDRPQLARTAYRKQAVRTPAEASRKIAAQRLGARPRKPLVEPTTAFGRSRSRKDDAVDMEDVYNRQPVRCVKE